MIRKPTQAIEGRRDFLKATGLASVGAFVAPTFARTAAAAETASVVGTTPPVDVASLPRVKQQLVMPRHQIFCRRQHHGQGVLGDRSSGGAWVEGYRSSGKQLEREAVSARGEALDKGRPGQRPKFSRIEFAIRRKGHQHESFLQAGSSVGPTQIGEKSYLRPRGEFL